MEHKGSLLYSQVHVLNQTKVILKFSILCISDQGICLLKPIKHIYQIK